MTLINPSDQTISQYSLQVGAANNLLANISAVATGQVLISGGVAANPAYSAYPQISGLGIGASPGVTAGITFDATNFLNAYVIGTYTPVLQFGGASVGIAYTTRVGNYTQIGNVVYFVFDILLSSKGSSTGTASFIGLPFTIGAKSVNMSIAINDHSNITITGFLNMYAQPAAATTGMNFAVSGVTGATSNMSDVNFTATSEITFSGFYFIT